MNCLGLPHKNFSRIGLRALIFLVAALAAILLVRPDASSASGLNLEVGGEQPTAVGGSVSVVVEGARGARSVALYVDGALRKRDRSWPWRFGKGGFIQLPVGEHQIVAKASFRGRRAVRRATVLVPVRRDLERRRSDVYDNRQVPTKKKEIVDEDDSAPPLPGGVFWAGDFESGDLSQWDIQQSVAPDRITIAHDPIRQGNYAARFEVRPGDNIGNTAPRAELATELGEQEGEERYYRWFTYFDPSFPTDMEDSFVTFTQWRATDESDAYTSFMVWGDQIELRRDGTHWSTPLVKGVWHEFVYHVKWSPDPNVGFIELWYDGQLVMPKVSVETMAGSPGAAVENYVKQGLYKSDEIPTGIVYHDGFVSGSTLESVRGA
ncbi:MAG TPA: polysaccharide lyase [Solirubrobacterales bacterium]|nr:polysaccharide lyase [Solirubrobacterales bacterium]